ncbi:MAG TPA: response regulator [Methylomirabilota bacterium]|jgi:two-component system, response regulator, stage 0 sporulation protein F|nr:response regulator [Methylomirabilota bacterium]
MASPGLGRILIVDDEQSVREVLSEYFTEQGYAVETAGDGEEALAQVQRSTPDLVLLDVRMPGLDGVETLRRIRGIAPDVAVIMVTANEDVGLARDTLKLGALDYVAKPFDFVYLERAIMAGLAQAEASGATATVAASADPWRDLALAVFQAVRRMNSVSRASTGMRLEDAAIAGARDAALGRAAEASATLGSIDLLLALATEMRDFTGAELGRVQSAVERARESLRR